MDSKTLNHAYVIVLISFANREHNLKSCTVLTFLQVNWSVCCFLSQFPPECRKMAKKRPELSAWGKYMKLGLIIGSFLYGVSKKKTRVHYCVVVEVRHILVEQEAFEKCWAHRHCEPPHAACSSITMPFTRCCYCRTPPVL